MFSVRILKGFMTWTRYFPGYSEEGMNFYGLQQSLILLDCDATWNIPWGSTSFFKYY